MVVLNNSGWFSLLDLEFLWWFCIGGVNSSHCCSKVLRQLFKFVNFFLSNFLVKFLFNFMIFSGQEEWMTLIAGSETNSDYCPWTIEYLLEQFKSESYTEIEIVQTNFSKIFLCAFRCRIKNGKLLQLHSRLNYVSYSCCSCLKPPKNSSKIWVSFFFEDSEMNPFFCSKNWHCL